MLSHTELRDALDALCERFGLVERSELYTTAASGCRMSSGSSGACTAGSVRTRNGSSAGSWAGQPRVRREGAAPRTPWMPPIHEGGGSGWWVRSVTQPSIDSLTSLQPTSQSIAGMSSASASSK